MTDYISVLRFCKWHFLRWNTVVEVFWQTFCYIYVLQTPIDRKITKKKKSKACGIFSVQKSRRWRTLFTTLVWKGYISENKTHSIFHRYLICNAKMGGGDGVRISIPLSGKSLDQVNCLLFHICTYAREFSRFTVVQHIYYSHTRVNENCRKTSTGIAEIGAWTPIWEN